MPKNIIICFDGTGNEPLDAVQKKKLFKVEDASISNILKLHFMFGGTLQSGVMSEKIDSDKQLSLYYSGVGTYGNGFQRILNQAFALPWLDVEDIKKTALEDLKQYYNDGDKIFLFGFSRGAALARQFASVIENSTQINVKEIPFMGVFDTVASIGVPDLDSDDRPKKSVVFEDCHVNKLVKKAVHLLSMDDKRKTFQPTLMNFEEPAAGEKPRIEEVWFSGAHSDVGGGYMNDGLSDICLEFMLEKIKENQLGLEVIHAANLNYEKLVPKQEKKIIVEYADLHSQPDPCGLSHEQERFFIIEKLTLDDRKMRVDVNDEKSDFFPTVHPSVVKRLQTIQDYRPKPLHRVEHKVLGEAESFTGYSHHKAARKPVPKTLEVDESAVVRVYANRKYTHSGILLRDDEEYMFKVTADQQWYDSTIDCGFLGWSLDEDEIAEKFGFLQRLYIKAKKNNRRIKDAKWFELCAAVGPEDKKGNLFKIQDHMETGAPFSPDENGEFCPFANDLDSMYHNNMGYIDMEIFRIS